MEVRTKEKILAAGIGAGIFLIVTTWAVTGVMSGHPAGLITLLLIAEILFTIACIAIFLREDFRGAALAPPLAAGFLLAVLVVGIVLVSEAAVAPLPPPPDSPAWNSGNQVIAMAVPSDEISTDSPEARELLIQGLTTASRDNRFAEAIPYYDRAIALDPDFSEAWMAKSVALFNLGYYTEASACVDRAILLDPENESARFLKERILSAMSRSGQAGSP